MTVTNSVEFYLGAFKQRAKALMQRQHRIVAALLVLLLPTLAFGQGETGGGEASLLLPDLKSVSFANFAGLNGHQLLSI